MTYTINVIEKKYKLLLLLVNANTKCKMSTIDIKVNPITVQKALKKTHDTFIEIH